MLVNPLRLLRWEPGVCALRPITELGGAAVPRGREAAARTPCGVSAARHSLLAEALSCSVAHRGPLLSLPFQWHSQSWHQKPFSNTEACLIM